MVTRTLFIFYWNLKRLFKVLFCTTSYLFRPMLLKAVLRTVEEFQGQAQAAVSDKAWRRESPPPELLRTLLEEGNKLPVVVPECHLLQGLQEQGRWLEEVRRTLGTEGAEKQEVTLEMLRSLMQAGCNVAQSVSVETAMAELQELLTIAERWEEKAQICLEHRYDQQRLSFHNRSVLRKKKLRCFLIFVFLQPVKNILFQPWRRL